MSDVHSEHRKSQQGGGKYVDVHLILQDRRLTSLEMYTQNQAWSDVTRHAGRFVL